MCDAVAVTFALTATPPSFPPFSPHPFFPLVETGLGTLSRGAYDLLGLQTFFTTGVEETRAWPVRKGKAGEQMRRTLFLVLNAGCAHA